MKEKDNVSDRRNFLKLGFLTGGAVISGAGIGSLMSGCTSTKKEDKEKVLTMDGKLVEVDRKSIEEHGAVKVTNPEVRQGIPGKKFVMVIDLAKCDGCGECTKACQKMHFVPPDREWIKVYRMQDTPDTASYWFPKPCFHCDNPPCTKVCPVDATFKRDDGIVLIDNDRCIGCRFCMAACPYSARFFNWGRPDQPEATSSTPYNPEQSYPAKIGTVEKCDFCPHATREGKLPGCVTGCPMNAIYFGDENEDAVTNRIGETVSFSQMIRNNGGYVYLEELGTKPRVYYLSAKNRRYPGPEMKENESIQES